MELKTEVLVIGCGIAGCASALAAARKGADVLLLSAPNDSLESNTAFAQGGIVTRGPGDTADLLVKDINEAGAGMCEAGAVRHLAEKAPELLDRLLVQELAVPFSHNDKGEPDVTEEAAHSLPRILHADDLTGRAIIQKMLAAVRSEKRITFLNGHLAVDLLNCPAHSKNRLDIYRAPCCVGAYILNVESGEVLTVTAQQTILATGGLGQIYLHTTNPEITRGDGIAMAYRLGARLLNLEYIQFHPTTLLHRDANSYLITESMRGEGGRLVDFQGNKFMEKYHPLGDLAPRDVVARSIQNEMLQSGRRCVYLDISHKDSAWISGRFPNIYENCLKYHIDITKQSIPVVPAAHYSCGGIAVDLLGKTTIPNLRAVGEVSCTGLHGANRLASTSLLEGLLWGWNAGDDAAGLAIDKSTQTTIPPIKPFIAQSKTMDPALIAQDWLTIKYTMWNYVGLTRSPRRMARAMSILRELQQEIYAFYQKAKPTESIVSLRNGVTTALAVLFAAQRNHASCGCHYIQKD